MCTSPLSSDGTEFAFDQGTVDQKQREQAEEDQCRLAAIVEFSNDAIVGKTLDGIITSWNLAAEKIFGYTAQEAIGQHISLIIPAELRAEEDTILQKLRKGQYISHFETVRMHKNGTRLDVSLGVSPIKNKAGQIIGAAKIVRDISERKRLQRQFQFLSNASKLLASSLDYKTTLQTIASLAVPHIADWCVIDMLVDERSIEALVIVHTDPQKVQWAKELRKKYPINLQDTYGIPQVLRTGISEFAPYISDDLLVATMGESEQVALLRRVGFTSAMIVPLIVGGKAVGTVSFVLAESGRHYTQADLAVAEELAIGASLAIQNARLYREIQQSRDQLNIILQGVADGIIVYNTHGHIIYANEAAARMTGFASAQAMRETPPTEIAAKYKIVNEKGEPLTRSQFTFPRVLAGEQEAESILGYTRIGREQPDHWSVVKTRPVFDEQGAVSMVVSIIHDITERVLEERRKDEFISMTSHELKTPITSLKGFTYVLQRRLVKQGDEQGLYYLMRIDTQLDKLTKLIADLLDVSRLQVGKLSFRIEAFDLDKVVHETVENVQTATATHRLIVEGRTSVSILGDKDRLGQVFINLLTNAVKYSSKADKVLVRLSQDQKQALVCVQDFGLGIDEAHHQKIFERFYQVTDPEERTYPGLGIGLYISREIVERHQGRIWVESSKGKGATFCVALPLFSEERLLRS